MTSIKIALRGAREDDRPFLRWLEEVCMREYAIALWGVWRPGPEEEVSLDSHRIIEHEGENVGCVATDRHVDHIWIGKLYIAPSHQRRGLRAFVLRLVISEAAASNLPVRLSVLTTNPAIAFYLREGLHTYEKTAERIFLTT
jgi:GNAT superfamily N-acetyltransferase